MSIIYQTPLFDKTGTPWTYEEDALLRALYLTHQRKEIAVILNRSVTSVRARCYTLKLNTKQPPWTTQEDALLRRLYGERTREPIDLNAIVAQMKGRSRASTAYRASKLGLTNICRKAIVTERVRAGRLGRRPSPGFGGHTHTTEMRRKMSIRVRALWKHAKATSTGLMSERVQQRRSDLMMTRVREEPALRTGHSNGKGGKRANLGDCYFRSAWEANIARYLNFLIAHGNLYKWEYEPDTFWFEEIKRGTRSYTPDFKLWDTPDSEPYYWEVKGWMDQPSRTKLDRMARYHPDVKIVLIGKAEYYAIAEYRRLIEGWEEKEDKEFTLMP